MIGLLVTHDESHISDGNLLKNITAYYIMIHINNQEITEHWAKKNLRGRAPQVQSKIRVNHALQKEVSSMFTFFTSIKWKNTRNSYFLFWLYMNHQKNPITPLPFRGGSSVTWAPGTPLNNKASRTEQPGVVVQNSEPKALWHLSEVGSFQS